MHLVMILLVTIEKLRRRGSPWRFECCRFYVVEHLVLFPRRLRRLVNSYLSAHTARTHPDQPKRDIG